MVQSRTSHRLCSLLILSTARPPGTSDRVNSFINMRADRFELLRPLPRRTWHVHRPIGQIETPFFRTTIRTQVFN